MGCGSGALAFGSFIIWVKGGCRRDSVTLHVLAVAGLVNSCANFLTGDYAVAVLTGNTVGIPFRRNMRTGYGFVYCTMHHLLLAGE